MTCFLKSFWILYIDQIIVYYAFYSKLTFYIIKERCQMHALKVFRSPLWILTVVKELRSKMFGQHPGYFKAVFLKQTRIIIVSIYKYTVYIMF